MNDKPSIRDRTGKLSGGPDGKLLTTEELAAYLGDVSVRTLEDWRRLGIGPDFVPLSAKLVRYRLRTVERWLDSLERKDRAGAVA